MTRQPDPRRVAKRDTGHCGRRGCTCTHTEGCDHGWLDTTPYTDEVTKQTYAPVEPCPVCRPEAVERMLA